MPYILFCGYCRLFIRYIGITSAKSKKGYNARLKSKVNSSNKLSFDDKNSILEALKK